MLGQACKTDPPTLEMQNEQHIVRLQSFERKHFHGEEVRSHHDRHVRTDKVLPTRRLLPLRGRRDIVPLEDIADCLIRDLAVLLHKLWVTAEVYEPLYGLEPIPAI